MLCACLAEAKQQFINVSAGLLLKVCGFETVFLVSVCVISYINPFFYGKRCMFFFRSVSYYESVISPNWFRKHRFGKKIAGNPFQDFLLDGAAGRASGYFVINAFDQLGSI